MENTLKASIEEIFEHYNEVGWQRLGKTTKIPFSSKYEFFTHWENYVRSFVEKTIPQIELQEASPRERLFEVTLARLEAAEPFKMSLKKLRKDLLKDPKALQALLKKSDEAAAFYLSYAGVSTFGPIGCLKQQAYNGIFQWTLHTWFDDTTKDNARTMSFLDNILGYCDKIMENYA